MNKFFLPGVLGLAIFSGSAFLFVSKNNFEISLSDIEQPAQEVERNEKPAEIPAKPVVKNEDEPNQKPLPNPPKAIKALYATSWSASSAAKMNYLIDLINRTEANAVVIDIKDYSGVVTYDIKVPDVLKYKAKEVRIPKINALIKRLHENNIYVIGRLTVFQDPKLAKARPDLAVLNSQTGGLWADRKGISWIDPGSIEAWKYNLEIAKDAYERGFDEINFDYIRFPSDGQLSLMKFQNSDLTKEKKSDVIRRFFTYVRENLPGKITSADLFGLTTVNTDDLGIGQVIEYAYETFDYVAPMIYPSHFAAGFLNYKNPAEKPYEVILDSMQNAVTRLLAHNRKLIAAGGEAEISIPIISSRLRPWLQDFDLGATYDEAKVRAQIKATVDSFCEIKRTPVLVNEKTTYKKSCEPLTEEDFEKLYGGWMLWDPRNNYTPEALAHE